jgi:hypothetical protein
MLEHQTKSKGLIFDDAVFDFVDPQSPKGGPTCMYRCPGPNRHLAVTESVLGFIMILREFKRRY